MARKPISCPKCKVPLTKVWTGQESQSYCHKCQEFYGDSYLERLSLKRRIEELEADLKRSKEMMSYCHKSHDWYSDGHLEMLALKRRVQELEHEVEKWKMIAFSPLGDNHHNAKLCPHCNAT